MQRKEFGQHSGRKERQDLIRWEELERDHNTPVKWISKEKNMILTTKMILDESNIIMPPEEMKEWNEKNGEKNNTFHHEWTWRSLPTKKGWTELLENQQQKIWFPMVLWKTSQNYEVKTSH
jgi:hypothetical protein